MRVEVISMSRCTLNSASTCTDVHAIRYRLLVDQKKNICLCKVYILHSALEFVFVSRLKHTAWSLLVPVYEAPVMLCNDDVVTFR